jgi:polynucleotide 5'-hydroxyl-kinase GRC3/NOL9
VAEWRGALEAILDAPGIVVMLGSVDAGKTTVATAIASAAIRAGRRTAVVDADTGQSDIGPPTTVALALPQYPARRMDQWKPVAAFFVGDTTPQAVYRYLIDGTVRSIALAQAHGAEIIVVDTTGWVQGDAAVAAKVRKLARVEPRHVVALQRHGEVEPILERLHGQVSVHRLRPSPYVRARSQEVRRAARVRRFRQYFMSGRLHALELDALPPGRLPTFDGHEIGQDRLLKDIPFAELRHLLVGLARDDERLKAVGSIVSAAPERNTVTALAPMRSLAGVAALQWGVLRVAPSGVEEGRLR